MPPKKSKTLSVRTEKEKIAGDPVTYHYEYHDKVFHPEGFSPKYHCIDKKSYEINKKNFLQYLEQRLDIARENQSGLSFCINSGYPILPLLLYGDLWHKGWDIPTRFAIDAEKQCWANNAHGGSLQKVEIDSLFSECEDLQRRLEIEKILGLPPSYTHCPYCGSLIEPDKINKGKK